MPKHNNKSPNNNLKLVKNAKQEAESKRLSLLEEILEESTSLQLNDASLRQGARQALDSHSRLLNLIDELRHVESGLNPKLPSRTEEGWKRFFTWLDSETSHHPGAIRNLKEALTIIKLESTRHINGCRSSDSECSLAAKKSFKKGETIFDIHRDLMLTNETAMKDKKLGEFIRKDLIASAMPNVVLVLHLLNEYSKRYSYWTPYLDILPSKILPVLTMNLESFKQMMASAHLFDALRVIRAIARQYSYFLTRHQPSDLPLAKDFTFQYYCWGVSVVCSRQNEIPASDPQLSQMPAVYALIPLLDMCNHHHGSNQVVFEDNHSTLIAPIDLEPGDEIRMNYGTRTSGEFYIYNAFVPDIVRLDVIPFRIDLSPQDPLFEQKGKLLKILNMPTFGTFRLVENSYENRHRRDPHLTMFLIVYFLSETELDMILKSDNPVGVADFIYEYVQYHQLPNDESLAKNDTNSLDLSMRPDIASIGERLSDKIKDYLSKRATIGIALIDRTIENKALDGELSRLLQHEKAMYQSYLIKKGDI